MDRTKIESAKSLLALTEDEKVTLSRWAVKTAFMIAVVQTIKFPLPWSIFRNLREDKDEGPHGCFVFAWQSPSLPRGFLFTAPSDYLLEGKPVQVRLGFSIYDLHFVVVIPIVQAPRMAHIAAGIHVPLWPLDAAVMATFKPFPPQGFDTASRFLDFLTNLIAVGLVEKENAVLLEVSSQTPPR